VNKDFSRLICFLTSLSILSFDAEFSRKNAGFRCFVSAPGRTGSLPQRGKPFGLKHPPRTFLLTNRLVSERPWNRKFQLSLMKAVLLFISALILACVYISACLPLGALIHKPSTSSVAETGAKQAGEHGTKGLMSPTPTPSPRRLLANN